MNSLMRPRFDLKSFSRLQRYLDKAFIDALELSNQPH